MSNPATQFVLKGFTQVKEFRVFVFEEVNADRTRTRYSVRTDLGLTRRYGISLQELPLLCRSILERRHLGEEQRAYTYTEEDMCQQHSDRAAEQLKAAARRKPPRRPGSEQNGTGAGPDGHSTFNRHD